MHNETEKMVDYDFLPFDNADIGIVFYLKQHEFYLKQEHALQLERNMVPMLIICTETSTKTCLSYKVLERGRKMVEAILDISSMLDAALVVLYNKILMVILLRFVKIAFSILAVGGGSEICMCA